MTVAEHITDEMLTRWMSGQATPDEESAVLDYIGESDENLDDFFTIATSARMIEDENVQSVRPLWRAVSVAASVALLLGVGIRIWHQSSGSDMWMDVAPAYGMMDTLVEQNMEDYL